MASVTAEYHYDNGEYVVFAVDVENEFPDAIDEARAVAVRGIRDLTGLEPNTVDIDPDVI